MLVFGTPTAAFQRARLPVYDGERLLGVVQVKLYEDPTQESLFVLKMFLEDDEGEPLFEGGESHVIN